MFNTKPIPQKWQIQNQHQVKDVSETDSQRRSTDMVSVNECCDMTARAAEATWTFSLLFSQPGNMDLQFSQPGNMDLQLSQPGNMSARQHGPSVKSARQHGPSV